MGKALNENTICVDELTDDQVAHIRWIVKDFADLNRK